MRRPPSKPKRPRYSKKIGAQYKKEALRPSPDHLTFTELASLLGRTESNVRKQVQDNKWHGTVKIGLYRFCEPWLVKEFLEINERRKKAALELGNLADQRFKATQATKQFAGQVASRVFKALEKNCSLAKIVIEQERSPEEVQRLAAEYANMRRGLFLDAKELLAIMTIFDIEQEEPSSKKLVEIMRRKVGALNAEISKLETLLAKKNEADEE
jgi:predicted transcriptional regulator